MRPCPVFTLYYTRAHPPFQPRPPLPPSFFPLPRAYFFSPFPPLSFSLIPTAKPYCKFIIAFISVPIPFLFQISRETSRAFSLPLDASFSFRTLIISVERKEKKKKGGEISGRKQDRKRRKEQQGRDSEFPIPEER